MWDVILQNKTVGGIFDQKSEHQACAFWVTREILPSETIRVLDVVPGSAIGDNKVAE
jgi:hypothetical protein